MNICDTDMLSVSRLIALVRDRPVLWDREEEVYKNRKLTKKAWSEICEALIDNYNELGEPEQQAIGRSVIGKWANLRDNWLRYWRKRQDLLLVGGSTRSLKKYIHHDALLFLSKVYSSEGQAAEEVEEIQVEVDVISDPEMESPLGVSSNDHQSEAVWIVAEDEVMDGDNATEMPLAEPERHVFFFHSIMPLICDFDEGQTHEFQALVMEGIRRVRYRGLGESVPVCCELQDSGGNDDKPSERNTASKATTTDDCFFPLFNSQVGEEEPYNHVETQTALANHPGKPRYRSSCCHRHLDNIESNLENLGNVVTKLEQISDHFSSFSHLGLSNNLHQFVTYIGTLLQDIPPTKIPFLKKKLTKEVLKAKFSFKHNSRNWKIKSNLIDEVPNLSADVNGLQNSVSKLEESSYSTSSTSLRTAESPGSSTGHSEVMSVKLKNNFLTCEICSSNFASTSDLNNHCNCEQKGTRSSHRKKTKSVDLQEDVKRKCLRSLKKNNAFS